MNTFSICECFLVCVYMCVCVCVYVSDQSTVTQHRCVERDGLLPAARHHVVRRSAHRRLDVPTPETSVRTRGHH